MVKRIMFVTDDAIDESLVNSFSQHGFEISIAEPASAYQQALASPPDLMAVDFTSAEGAMELLKKVRSSAALNETFVLAMAEWGTGQATLALSNGADGFEPKPIDAARLLEAVEKLLRPRLVMAAAANDK
jgi:DNA-binding response OmpR family regulator